MTKQEYKELSFEEVMERLNEECNNVTTYDTLKNFAIERINKNDLLTATHILEAIQRDEGTWYEYDYSMGTLEVPYTLRDKGDVEHMVGPVEEDMTGVVWFMLNGVEVYGAYRSTFEENDKDVYLDWLAEKHNCKPEDIEIIYDEFDEDDEDIDTFFCDGCGRLGIYKYKGDEKDKLISYVCYGNPERYHIQDILPDMPAWMRESFIKGGMGTICPTCMKAIYGGEED